MFYFGKITGSKEVALGQAGFKISSDSPQYTKNYSNSDGCHKATSKMMMYIIRLPNEI